MVFGVCCMSQFHSFIKNIKNNKQSYIEDLLAVVVNYPHYESNLSDWERKFVNEYYNSGRINITSKQSDIILRIVNKYHTLYKMMDIGEEANDLITNKKFRTPIIKSFVSTPEISHVRGNLFMYKGKHLRQDSFRLKDVLTPLGGINLHNVVNDPREYICMFSLTNEEEVNVLLDAVDIFKIKINNCMKFALENLLTGEEKIEIDGTTVNVKTSNKFLAESLLSYNGAML